MGMQNIASLDRACQTVVQLTRDVMQEPSFCRAHRVSDQCFIRRRKLTFVKVMVTLLQKTVRSIQLHLHDFFGELGQHSVVASSWCEARLKLKHTAFIELNRRAILEVAYGGQSGFPVRRWKGHRLLGMDSSLIRLPDEPAVGQEFGWMEFSHAPGVGPQRCAQGRLSVLTDVLNRLAIETILTPWKQCEREVVLAHWPQLEPQDVSLLDRGFASYELWARFVAHQRWFVCRCPDSSFAPINQLFAQNQAGRSLLVTLSPPASKRVAVGGAGLPETITLRLVTVRLESGQLEVLATNLLDPATYAVEDLREVYGYRWGMETYYGLIKGRLDLENFSGLSVEAIRQDLHATVFLSNLESILTRPAQAQLQEASQQGQHQAQVNRAVSFHAIKRQMIPLLLSAEPVAQVLPKLQRLFLRNPVYNRPKRKVPRQKKSPWRSYNYQRNIKKAVF
jgi:hypothetical protein